MNLAQVVTLEDAKQYLRERKVVSREVLHTLRLQFGSEASEELYDMIDELGIELVGPAGR